MAKVLPKKFSCRLNEPRGDRPRLAAGARLDREAQLELEIRAHLPVGLGGVHRREERIVGGLDHAVEIPPATCSATASIAALPPLLTHASVPTKITSRMVKSHSRSSPVMFFDS